MNNIFKNWFSSSKKRQLQQKRKYKRLGNKTRNNLEDLIKIHKLNSHQKTLIARILIDSSFLKGLNIEDSMGIAVAEYEYNCIKVIAEMLDKNDNGL